MKSVALIDWRADFTAGLADLLLAEAGGDLRGCLVLFPHQRPRRHLMRHLARREDVPKPLFLPAMTAVGEWLPALARELDPAPLRTAGQLDRAALLREVVAALPGPGPLGDLATKPDRFFPWGRRLADLLEELFRHGVEPRDLHNVEGEVQDTAAALLQRLAAIHAGYTARLAERGWTTPGLDARLAASRAAEIPALLGGRRVFIAGFHALTGTEEAVFRALAEDGARLVWHSDPALAEDPGRAHWSCREHARQLADWRLRAELQGAALERPAPRLKFHEGYDLHSQLGAMRDLLADADLTDTAIVVPDTGSLMPVLHHLPVKDVNISMGYPLERSSLFRLLETVLRLQETANEAPGAGRYYWREVTALIRHPYVKMLEPEPGLPLRGLLRELERWLRSGGKWADPLDWEPDEETLAAALPAELPEGADPARALELLRETLAACLTAFEAPASLEEFGRALLGLARTLVPEGGEHVWHRFPVDAECLHRLAASVVPALTDSRMSAEPLDRPVLFSILRQLMRAERVPFEAEPLTGLQVMGMLESRLLRFSRVIVLDATEDKLPGAPAYDPLLPDPLRALLDLPDGRMRSQVAAYNFHRLMAGADEAHVLYQCGADAPGPQGGKAIRSRFVEELLWEEERRAGRIIRPGDGGPIAAITLPVRPLPPRRGSVAKTPAVLARLERLLATRELSASLLDTYLDCPLRFFHRYLTPLREPDTVSEDGDPLELGTLVHKVLQDFLEPWRGRRVDIAALDPTPLLDDFSARLEAAPFFTQMPFDLRLGMAATGRERLSRFVAASPDTTVLELEQNLSARLDVDGHAVRLGGRFDRVDRRPGGDVILDYKTGSVPEPTGSVWRNEVLWAAVEDWTPEEPEAEREDGPGAADALGMLRDKLRSVQLPLYAWIYWRERDILPANAAWVELRDRGQETALFDGKVEDEEREAAVTELTPLVARFLVRHMREAPAFEGTPGPRCRWCPYGHACPAPPRAFKGRA